jgi:hypothetical protein
MFEQTGQGSLLLMLHSNYVTALIFFPRILKYVTALVQVIHRPGIHQAGMHATMQ